jgi:hypothetical protein
MILSFERVARLFEQPPVTKCLSNVTNTRGWSIHRQVNEHKIRHQMGTLATFFEGHSLINQKMSAWRKLFVFKRFEFVIILGTVVAGEGTFCSHKLRIFAAFPLSTPPCAVSRQINTRFGMNDVVSLLIVFYFPNGDHGFFGQFVATR